MNEITKPHEVHHGHIVLALTNNMRTCTCTCRCDVCLSHIKPWSYNRTNMHLWKDRKQRLFDYKTMVLYAQDYGTCVHARKTVNTMDWCERCQNYTPSRTTFAASGIYSRGGGGGGMFQDHRKQFSIVSWPFILCVWCGGYTCPPQ